jgi:FkbM family methyltransferase
MSLIIDIGANVGTFTKFYNMMYPDCDFVCVEANPDLIPILHGMFKGNDNVKILDRLAGSEDNKIVDFWINDNHCISTASESWKDNSRFSGYGSYRKTTAKVITLDTIIRDHGKPNMIKIDVEGYELEVLKGLTVMPENPDCEIIFEWVEERFSKTIECIKYLMELGYRKFGYTLKDNYAEKPSEYTDFNEMNIFKTINLLGKDHWGNIHAK